MKTPWHLWVIGILTAIWNAGGAYDYVMTQTANETYLSYLTESQRAFLEGLPPWFVAFWALGVWASLAGSLLLLLRSRHATMAFLVSLISLILSALYSWGIADPSGIDINGGYGIGIAVLMLIILVGLWIYSARMVASGVLR